MPITYKYDVQKNIVTTSVTGALYSSDIIQHLYGLIKDREIKSNFIELADFSGVEDLILKYSDLISIADIANELIELHRLTIFSAFNGFSQAMLEMMMPLFHSVDLNVIVCKNENEVKENLNIFLECDD